MDLINNNIDVLEVKLKLHLAYSADQLEFRFQKWYSYQETICLSRILTLDQQIQLKYIHDNNIWFGPCIFFIYPVPEIYYLGLITDKKLLAFTRPSLKLLSEHNEVFHVVWIIILKRPKFRYAPDSPLL